MTLKKPPLSPHLQVYKPQITSFTSILHRATGAFLYIGIVIICWAIFHYAYQIDVMTDESEIICDCIWEKIWKIVLYVVATGWAFSLYYHLCNGIRYLFWNIGKGFEITTARKTGVMVVAFALLLTISSLVFILFFKMI